MSSRALTDVRGRGLFDDLLVAALYGAFALRQRHDAAAAVPKDLDLDVPRPLHILLHENARVAKARFALPACIASPVKLADKTLGEKAWPGGT